MAAQVARLPRVPKIAALPCGMARNRALSLRRAVFRAELMGCWGLRATELTADKNDCVQLSRLKRTAFSTSASLVSNRSWRSAGGVPFIIQ